MERWKKRGRRLLRVIAVVVILFQLFLLWTKPITPEILKADTIETVDVQKINDSSFSYKNNWLRKNDAGFWEMYVEGDAYERGTIYGALAKKLIQKQEDIFVDQIKKLLPGKTKQKTIKYFVRFFNRDMDDYIPLEYQKEIYGISQYFSQEHNFIAAPYQRILNYHAAHDIGHALQDLNIVGCTSMAVKGDKTVNGDLLIGRNFDFYMGDDFAKEQLLLFMKPTKGYAFATYSWAGFVGVVSGMNEKGLTITINAAASDVPLKAKTPISILAREILQYASTTEEAIAIAKKRQTFVSESLLIGSASENWAILIEKTPERMDVFSDKGDELICTNHYQSDGLKGDEKNIKNIDLSDSKYRYDRVKELLNVGQKMDQISFANILRNQKGLQDEDLGYGNQKALNQLIAHHSIIFKPRQFQFWVSAPPNPMAQYVGYDMKTVFGLQDSASPPPARIGSNSFLQTPAFAGFEYYKRVKDSMQSFIIFGTDYELQADVEQKMLQSNPENYFTYVVLAQYFEEKNDLKKALFYYRKSLTKSFATKSERLSIEETVKTLSKKQ